MDLEPSGALSHQKNNPLPGKKHRRNPTKCQGGSLGFLLIYQDWNLLTLLTRFTRFSHFDAICTQGGTSNGVYLWSSGLSRVRTLSTRRIFTLAPCDQFQPFLQLR